jgi:signal transduction histidine kinase
VAVPLEEDKALYGFVGAFVVVALAFLAASVATFLASREIDTAAQDLLGNALPSVMELMHARSAQRRLDIDVEVLSRTPSARAQLVDELAAARTDLDTSLGQAMATPNYPGELELYQRDVRPRLDALDGAIGELRAAIAKNARGDGRIVTAVNALNASAKDLDGALAALGELNQARAFDAASRIVGTRAQSVRLAFFLEAASTLLALAAAVVAVHGQRRFARDARRRLEMETERAAELDILAQRVAHDLMSPLAAVALSLGAIQRAHPDPDTTRALDRAGRALQRSRQMVQGIYAFSGSGARPAPGATAPLRATVVEAADELLATEAQSPPAIEVQPFEEVQVAMDRAVLGVVVANLLSNASKYSRDAPVRRVIVSANADEERVHVEVEDTGPGVPPGLEQAIFEPYRRAPGVSQPGLGLGLATVKRLVLTHGGNVGVRSVRPGGAVFWFDLPRAPAKRREPLPEAPLRARGGEPNPVH